MFVLPPLFDLCKLIFFKLILMYVNMEAMMIVKDGRASLAEEDGMKSQANTDGFQELLGNNKIFPFIQNDIFVWK